MRELEAVGQYLPRALLGPDTSSRWWLQQGTLLFSDVSGFTALSEKLARHGKAGAEEMVTAISTVFTPLLEAIDQHGGDVLKFGGDALLTFFDGPGHESRAASCAHRLRRLLRAEGRVRTTFGEVPLGMSQGAHSGEFYFAVAGGDFADLVVTGSSVSHTLAMESAAARGEILLSATTAAALRADLLSVGHDGGTLLRSAPQAARGAEPARPSAAAPHERFVPRALRGRLADIVDDSEHRRVTVGFLQFRGCDRILVEDGPDELHRCLGEMLDAVTVAADEYGVTVICVDVAADGGKVMLACGAPDAHERDSELMLRFGTDVVGRDLPMALRLGVNRGAVYAGRVGGPQRWTYSTMGDPVNLAARITGKAPGGHVLATRVVVEQTGDVVRAEPVAPFSVKGKAQPVETALVIDVTARTDISATDVATPFVGRSDELAKLTAAWRSAAAGDGRTVEIEAPAGTGKSRLVGELLAAAKPPLVLRAAGERYHQGTAYFAAHLVIRGVLGISPDAHPAQAGDELTAWVLDHAPDQLPWLPLVAVAARAQVNPTEAVDQIASEFRAAQLRNSVVALLVAALPTPAVLLLEDAFWYDEASVQLFEQLLREVHRLPLLVVVTRRPEPIGLRRELGYPAEVVQLPPLGTDDALALARAVAPRRLAVDEARHLADVGQGNPFFVLQMARSWQADAAALPGDVETVVAARLDQLPIAARRLLSRAAVLGGYVDVPLLEHVLDGPVDEGVLRPLLGEYLLEDGPGRLRFAHDLFRTVAYDGLPFRRRRQLHERAARALEEMGDRNARAALLSVHFEAAGDARRAWEYARVAGERARAAYATAEAADLYDRALRAAKMLDDLATGDVAAVAEALGDAEELSGRYDRAAAAYAMARRLAATDADAVRLLSKLGVVRERQGRYREALAWYTRGLRQTPRLDDDAGAAARARLLVHRAAVRYRQGKFRDTVRHAREAASAAQAAEARTDLAHAYLLLDAALTDLQDAAAVEYRDRALPIYQELGDLVGEADVHNNIGIDAYYEGRLDDALASYRRSLECRRQAGDVVGAATVENNIGEVLSDLGRLDEARPMFEEALAVWQRTAFPAGIALASSNLGLLDIRSGQPEAAAPFLDEAERLFAQMGSEMLLFETRARRAEMLLAIGERVAAAQLAQELLTAASALSPPTVVVASLRRTLDEAQSPPTVTLPQQRTVSLPDATDPTTVPSHI